MGKVEAEDTVRTEVRKAFYYLRSLNFIIREHGNH